MIRTFALLATAAPAAAFAHDGHGLATHPVIHQLADPSHLLPVLLTVGAVAAVMRLRRLRR